MKIRKIKESELDYLWNFEKENREYDKRILGKKFWLFYPNGTDKKEKIIWLKDLKKSFKDKNTKILIVEIKGKLAGYSWINIYFLKYLKPKKKVGYINEFFLTEKFRGKGISTKLMNETMKWLKQKKIKFVSLCVFAKNKEVVNVYKKFGFEPFSIYMKKKI